MVHSLASTESMRASGFWIPIGDKERHPEGTGSLNIQQRSTKNRSRRATSKSPGCALGGNYV